MKLAETAALQWAVRRMRPAPRRHGQPVARTFAALAATIFELGSYVVELQGRRRRTFGTLMQRTNAARAALDAGDARPRTGRAARIPGRLRC